METKIQKFSIVFLNGGGLNREGGLLERLETLRLTFTTNRRKRKTSINISR